MRIILSAIAMCLVIFLAVPVMQGVHAAANADKDAPPPWQGRYCNEERCLSITNLVEGPEGGYFFDFVFTAAKGGKLGAASAMVDERWASYSALIFTLGDGNAVLAVSLDPGLDLDADDAWLKVCPGAYARKSPPGNTEKSSGATPGGRPVRGRSFYYYGERKRVRFVDGRGNPGRKGSKY